MNQRPAEVRGAGARAPERIVLVGFMGAGKSTVGMELAQLLGWGFLDMDQRIEELAGVSIARIFEQQGETAFRAIEQRVAVELAGLQHYVVAAGGGAFARAETRRALQFAALTVWLQVDIETLLGRVATGQARPLAANRERMAVLFAEREPSYRLADWAVDAAGASPAQVAQRIWEDVMGRGTPQQ